MLSYGCIKSDNLTFGQKNPWYLVKGFVTRMV